MAQFENYLEKKKQGGIQFSTLYQEQKNKSLTWNGDPDYAIPYSSEDMGEMFDERMSEKISTYEQRTAYYFKDSTYMAAKALRYAALSENTEATNKFAQIHTNRWGKTRRNRASDAWRYFTYAWEEQKKQEADRQAGRGPQTQYDTYKLREKIMNYRLDGMIAAAKAKSRSGIHEEYMKLRAKLSCYTILKDQAENLLHEVPVDQAAQIGQFKEKIRTLDNKIKSVKTSIASSIPSAKDTWQKWIDMKGQGQSFKNRARTQGVTLSTSTSEMAYCLERCLDSMGKVSYPCTVPLKHTEGAPVTHGELKKAQWNERYQEALKKNDRKKLERLKLEAIKRFEEYQIPALADLQSKGSVPYFMMNPSAFMENVFYAAPYYNEKIKEKSGFYHKYAEENPKFVEKVKLLHELSQNFRRELRVKHNLRIDDQKGKVVAERFQGQQPTDQELRREFAGLYQAYTTAAPSKQGKSAASRIEAQDIFNSIPTEKLDGSEDGNPDSSDDGSMIFEISTSSKGAIHEEERLDEDKKEEKKEDKKEEKKEDQSSINLKQNEQEDEKEENRNRTIIKKEKEENRNRIIMEEEEEEEINTSEALPKITYRRDKKTTHTFSKKVPKNLMDAISLRKEISDKVLEADLRKKTEVKELYDYYNSFVQNFLKTEKYEYDRALLTKEVMNDPTQEHVAELRNKITETGVKPEELPQELKDVYDYYDGILQDLIKNEGRLGTVVPHEKRKTVSHTAFLETKIGESYETQAFASNDCWSCAGAGILNHFTRREPPMTQEEFRAFKPSFRSMTDMGLDPDDPQDQADYQRRMRDVEGFTFRNNKKDRQGSPDGNTFTVSDIYLREFAKNKDLKNTAVHQMRFQCNAAKNNLKDDPNLLHNMMEKFKDTIEEAIYKKSAIALLMPGHYVTITGIKGDQLEVCDSNMSRVASDTVYKVSSLFNPENPLSTLELTWFERIDDPQEIAGKYQNLSYDGKSRTFTGKPEKAVENIALHDGVEAWKTVEEKDEDISLFYAEGIYLPKTFTTGLKKNEYSEVNKTSFVMSVNKADELFHRVPKKTDKKDGAKKSQSPPKQLKKPETTGKKSASKKGETKKTQKNIITGPIPETLDLEDRYDIDPSYYLHSEELVEEFEKLRETNPYLTLRGFRYYRWFQRGQRVLEDAELKKMLSTQVQEAEKAGKPLFKNPDNADISMAPAALLLDVHYREDGTVFPDYKVNAERNKQWIQSWAAGKEKEREKLLEEMLTEQIASLEIPNPQELRTGWIEDQMDSNYMGFTGMVRRMSAMERLMEEYPDLMDALALSNPFAHAKLEAAMSMTAYIKKHMLRYYGFSLENPPAGCTMQAPPEKEQGSNLKKQTDNALETYVKSYNKFSEKDTERILTLKKDGFYEFMVELDQFQKKLNREAKENLEKTPEYIQEQEELKKEEQRAQDEKKRREAEQKEDEEQSVSKENSKIIRKNPDVSKETLQKSEEIRILMREVQEETDKNPQKKKPLSKEKFPSPEQLKNGWVENMFREHTRELIDLIQNGRDETDENQRFAFDDLVRIICMEVFEKFEISIDRNGKSCIAKKPVGKRTNDKPGMMSFIEGPLNEQYKRMYNEYMGLKEEEKEDKKEENNNKIIEEEENLNEIIEEKTEEQKGGKGKKVSKDSQVITRQMAGLDSHISEKDREELARVNQGVLPDDKYTGGTIFAMNALKESIACWGTTEVSRALNHMRDNNINPEKIDNTFMGAPSALIQSVHGKIRADAQKNDFNKVWTSCCANVRNTNEEKRNVYLQTQNEMIETYLGQIFNGFRLPSPDQLRGNWFEETMKTNSFKLFEVLRKAQAVPRLIMLNQTARNYYNNHPVFKKMVDACVLLDKYARSYLKLFLRVDMAVDTGWPSYAKRISRGEFMDLQDALTSLVDNEYTVAYNSLTEDDIQDFAEAQEPEYKIPQVYTDFKSRTKKK